MDTKKEPGSGRKTKLFQKTNLSPRAILALKALLLYVLFIHRGIFLYLPDKLPYLPFFTFLDNVPSFLFSFAIALLFLCILTVLLKKGNYQVLSLSSGIILLVLILSSKLVFSNSLTFVACLLVLTGLVKDSSFIFRIQISLLYLGAAINKAFDPDWWNGMYFDFFLRDVFDVTLYQSWISAGNMTVAKGLGITTIFSEFLLGIIVLIPKLTRLTIILGLFFHGTMLVITSGQLSVRFYYIMSAAFLFISNIPVKPIIFEHPSRFLKIFLKYLDFSDSLIIRNRDNNSFSIIIDDVKYSGRQAIRKLFLSSQFLLSFYFLSILLYMVAPFLVNKLISALF